MLPGPVLGVDFDNTLISYDRLMLKIARRRGLVPRPRAASAGKKWIRDRIRSRPNGEIEWRKLQAAVYGPLIGQARLIPGVRGFFSACKKKSIPVYIVSHKTRRAAEDETGTDLRSAALRWMEKNRFFDRQKMGIHRRRVFFEPTREKKLKRIARLGCTHFIDDLEETFLERDFPKSVEKILYRPGSSSPRRLPGGLVVLSGWPEIRKHLFHA